MRSTIDGYQMLQDPSRRTEEFDFVDPQTDHELLSWFPNQSSTASIRVKLDPNWRDGKLIGFAMVFYFRANSSTDSFCCDIRVGYSKNWASSTKVDTIYFGCIESRMSDHLYLLYRHLQDALEGTRQLEPPNCDNLEFSFLCLYHEECSTCGLCGLRLVYEEDIESSNKTASPYNNDQSPPSKEGCTLVTFTR